jgi:outer membrane translocation and assembly module TamA
MTEARGMAAPDASAAVAAAPTSGVRVRAEGFFVPEAWDVTADFGGLDGSVAGYVGSQKLVLATQVGGRMLWGPYPWFESAGISGRGGGIGGAGRVRGYYDGRFRGDSSLYGNAELRFWIGHRKKAVLPLRWGLTAFCESGRVWYAGEDSKKWHTGYGVGLLVQLIGTPMSVGGSVANGTEGVKLYVAGGYSF